MAVAQTMRAGLQEIPVPVSPIARGGSWHRRAGPRVSELSQLWAWGN